MIKYIINLVCIVLVSISGFGLIFATKLKLNEPFLLHWTLIACVYFIGYKYVYKRHRHVRTYIFCYLIPLICTYGIIILRLLGVDIEFPIVITLKYFE